MLSVAILGLVLAIRPRAARLSRPLAIALGALAAYVAFSYLSILWADQPGAALQGSHRTLLYASLAATCALLPWTPALARAAVGVLAGAGAVAAIVTLTKLHGATGTGGLFLDARLSYPLDYHNATAALFTMVALPAIALASRREVHPLARGLLLGSATLCQCLALMTVSRGWLFTLPIVLLIAVIVLE